MNWKLHSQWNFMSFNFFHKGIACFKSTFWIHSKMTYTIILSHILGYTFSDICCLPKVLKVFTLEVFFAIPNDGLVRVINTEYVWGNNICFVYIRICAIKAMNDLHCSGKSKCNKSAANDSTTHSWLILYLCYYLTSSAFAFKGEVFHSWCR